MSRIFEAGYINVYSELNTKERCALAFNRKYKQLNPAWDNTMVLLCKKFGGLSLFQPVVLDAGCGNGNYVVDEFRSKISLACGVDANTEATAKNICLDEIKYSPLEEIPYENNKFDVALSLWVVEHLKNPTEVFEEIYRVLKPGGFFLFATPNKDFLPIRVKNLLNLNKINIIANKLLYGREEKDIFRTFYGANDEHDLRNRLENAKFEEIQIDLNYDPGYTSFNEITFKVSNLLSGLPWFKAHLVGLARKGLGAMDLARSLCLSD